MKKKFTSLIAIILIAAAAVAPIAAISGKSPGEQVIFPGQARPEISRGIIKAYGLALDREYEKAREICLALGRKFPRNPAGPAGETVLYQVMMLENEDYNMDEEFRDAAERAQRAAAEFARTAPENDWYYTLLGATWGIQGIYFLRRGEYLSGMYYGVKGLSHMNTAVEMSPDNWEARMGIGLYLYYRSAYARYIPVPWFDQREKGIEMIREAGANRGYLEEVSRIALYYVYVNEKEYDRACSYMDGLIEDNPDFPVFHQLAARAMMEKGDYERAREYYLEMTAIDPGLYLPYFKLGQCEMKLGNEKQARRHFDEFFQVLGGRRSMYEKPARRYLRSLS